MDAGLSVHRIRIVLNVTQDVRRLHAFHAPILYALLSEAFGKAQSQPPALPDGMMIDAPEQCRVHLDAGEEYAFGFSLLAPSPGEAQRIVQDVVRGLQQLGQSKRVAGAALVCGVASASAKYCRMAVYNPIRFSTGCDSDIIR